MKIKYFSEDYPRLEKLSVGDHIDLRVDRIDQLIRDGATIKNIKLDGSFELVEGDVVRFGLGVAMELPIGYEAHISPRSSTFKYWGMIQTNSVGIIDNSYCGDKDEWLIEFIVVRDSTIQRFDRVCQFRLFQNQPKFEIVEVEHLGNDNRGGYGNSGKN